MSPSEGLRFLGARPLGVALPPRPPRPVLLPRGSIITVVVNKRRCRYYWRSGTKEVAKVVRVKRRRSLLDKRGALYSES